MILRLSAFADEASPCLAEQLKALKENNISQIEIRNVNGKNISALTDEEVAEAKKMLDEAGITVSALGSPYGKYPADQPFDVHFADFKRGLDIADALGAKCIRMFSFYTDRPGEYRDEILSRLKQMIDEADKHGITLYHENEKGIYGDVKDRVKDLMMAFRGRMKFIFDPANFIQCGVETGSAFDEISSDIYYMHVKDALKEDGSVVPAGCGDGCLVKILSSLGRDMTLSVEPHLRVFDGLGNLQTEELRTKYVYGTSREAFDAAVSALKKCLTEIGYTEGDNGTWMK